MYGTVKWLNASDAVGKIKKNVEILTIVFIFKSAVVLLAHERIKAKKKSKVGLPHTAPARAALAPSLWGGVVGMRLQRGPVTRKILSVIRPGLCSNMQRLA